MTGRQSHGAPKVRYNLRRHVIAVAILSLLLIALAHPWQLKLDNSLDIWIQGAPGEAQYQEFKKRFGSDRFLLASWYGDDLFSRNHLDAAVDFYATCKTFPHVEPASVFGVPTLWKEIRNHITPPEFAELTKQDPVLQGLYCAEDGQALGLMIPMVPNLDPIEGAALCQEVRKALADFGSQIDCETALVGPNVLNAALDHGSARDGQILFPLLFALSSLSLLVYFRKQLGSAIMILVCSGLTVGLSLSAYAFFHPSLDMITVTIPTLAWILALSLNIHSLHRLQTQDQTKSILKVLKPSLLAASTTAIGFAAIGATSVGPVSSFGTFVGVGVVISLLLTITILAPLARPSTKNKKSLPNLPVVESSVGHGHKKAIIALGGFLAVLAFLPARSIKAESRVLEFLPESHAIRRDYDLTRTRLGGVSPIELDLELHPGVEASPAIKEIGRRARLLEAMPHIAKVFGIDQIRQLVARWSIIFKSHQVPLSPDFLIAVSRMKDHFSHNEGRHQRVTILVDDVSSQVTKDVLGQVQKLFPPNGSQGGFNTEITGTIPLLNASHEEILADAIESLIIALIAAIAAVLLLTRQLGRVSAVMLPILAPPLSVMAFMGIFGIPLDLGTMMVASVSAGIGIDDTLHMLAAYGDARKSLPALDALALAQQTCGQALIVTTAVNVTGFAVLCLASFRPIRWFGGLTALALLTALLADLLLLPAALYLWDKKSNTPPHPLNSGAV